MVKALYNLLASESRRLGDRTRYQDLTKPSNAVSEHSSDETHGCEQHGRSHLDLDLFPVVTF
jgi:hypothetical protein